MVVIYYGLEINLRLQKPRKNHWERKQLRSGSRESRKTSKDRGFLKTQRATAARKGLLRPQLGRRPGVCDLGLQGLCQKKDQWKWRIHRFDGLKHVENIRFSPVKMAIANWGFHMLRQTVAVEGVLEGIGQDDFPIVSEINIWSFFQPSASNNPRCAIFAQPAGKLLVGDTFASIVSSMSSNHIGQSFWMFFMFFGPWDLICSYLFYRTSTSSIFLAK